MLTKNIIIYIKMNLYLFVWWFVWLFVWLFVCLFDCLFDCEMCPFLQGHFKDNSNHCCWHNICGNFWIKRDRHASRYLNYLGMPSGYLQIVIGTIINPEAWSWFRSRWRSVGTYCACLYRLATYWKCLHNLLPTGGPIPVDAKNRMNIMLTTMVRTVLEMSLKECYQQWLQNFFKCSPNVLVWLTLLLNSFVSNAFYTIWYSVIQIIAIQ